MATHSRTERVAALIQEELGRIFARGLKDPRIGFITLTGAKVSPDLREAWIYYAVHGGDAERARTAQGLMAARGFLRRELGARLSLRVTPDLHFVVDEAIDHGARIDELIQQVHMADAERAARGVAGDGESAPGDHPVGMDPPGDAPGE